MKFKFKPITPFAVALVALLSASFLINTAAFAGSGNSPKSKIVLLNIGSVVQVKLKDLNGDNVNHNPTNGDGIDCAVNDGVLILAKTEINSTSGIENTSYEDVLAGLLLARGTGQTVRIWTNGCFTSAGKERPAIGSVNIQD